MIQQCAIAFLYRVQSTHQLRETLHAVGAEFRRDGLVTDGLIDRFFMPDPKTGRNTAISAAFRFTAKPAFVVDPPTPLAVDQPPYPGGDKAMTERERFLKATTTRAIQPEFIRKPEANQQVADSAQPTKPQTQGADY